MKDNFLSYREKVSAVIFDKNDNFLIVQLMGYRPDDWNFSGGGVEEGETEEEAILRELKEELGTDKFKILKKSKQVIKYDWPSFVIAKRLKEEGKTYRGQKQNMFLVEFTGKKEDIKPDPKEIKQVKWVKYGELKDCLNFPNQWESAEKVIGELFN